MKTITQNDDIKFVESVNLVFKDLRELHVATMLQLEMYYKSGFMNDRKK